MLQWFYHILINNAKSIHKFSQTFPMRRLAQITESMYDKTQLAIKEAKLRNIQANVNIIKSETITQRMSSEFKKLKKKIHK